MSERVWKCKKPAWKIKYYAQQLFYNYDLPALRFFAHAY